MTDTWLRAMQLNNKPQQHLTSLLTRYSHAKASATLPGSVMGVREQNGARGEPYTHVSIAQCVKKRNTSSLHGARNRQHRSAYLLLGDAPRVEEEAHQILVFDARAESETVRRQRDVQNGCRSGNEDGMQMCDIA